MRNKDYTASVQFLDWLFAWTENPVELRCITDGKSPRANFVNAADDIVSFCTRYDQPGSAVYFGMATRTPGSTKGDRAHCTELPAFWSDIDCVARGIDSDEALSALLSLPKPPSCIVHSGRGLHAYWKLKEALDVSSSEKDETIVAVLRQLAGVTCGDPKVCDIARVMRLPGTTNYKAEPVECTVLYGPA